MARLGPVLQILEVAAILGLVLGLLKGFTPAMTGLVFVENMFNLYNVISYRQNTMKTARLQGDTPLL